MKRLRNIRYIWLLVVLCIGMTGFMADVCKAKQQWIEIDLSSDNEKDPDWDDVFDEEGPDEEDLELDWEDDLDELKISKPKLDLLVGEGKQLKVAGAFKKVKWKSSNTKIATVSQKGEVTGKKYGTATVRVISGGQQAACKVTVYVSKKQASQWVEKNGRCYYYGKYGQKVTGRKEIGGKAYYFDSKGRQRTGWLKIGKSYYYYHIAKGAEGYLVKNKTVNQIKVGRSGKAEVTGANQTKAYILARCSGIVFENTDWTMARSEALKKLFIGFAGGKSITYKNIGSFQKEGNWPERYAMVYLNHGYGDCYTVGCIYAYLAVALGCKEVYAQSSGGHGWCRIDGKYYDPNWAFWGTENINDGFAAPEAFSGKGGRPCWKSAASYSVKLN